ncbi:flavin-containing monooxygenase [Nocardia sp. NPDC127579]|uniref:flavin-containing monooxygenase n=1 Tax=Nocardia sp. NPDC127579 TaxID=3345402 RepID=UPI00362681C0
MSTSEKSGRADGRAAPSGRVDHEAVVIGAGFSGLGAAIELSRLGIDYAVLERSDDVGGAWHANRYPGIGVDTAAPTYSYSFAPNPDWSRLYAPGAEVQQYAARIADDYAVRRRIRFATTVTGAHWDEASGVWTVGTADGRPVTCRMLIVATGLLSQVRRPDIAGLDSFTGAIVHTAAWDDEVDLTGKRVALIGTGATAVQLLPEIADRVEHIEVYQRRPIWVAPKPDFAMPPLARSMFRRLPGTQRALRFLNAAANEVLALAFLVYRFFPPGIAALEALCRLHLRMQVRDKEIRSRLTPDYTFWCKRPTFSNHYLRTFNRAEVDLVTAPIERVAPHGIVTADGVAHDVDVLILATGFVLQQQGSFPPFPIVGRAGVEMGDWFHAHGYESYEGIAVAGYPNLFYLSGPYSFAGLSYFFAVESQMAHIRRVVTEMRRRCAGTFEVKRPAQQRFVAGMDRLLRASVWRSSGCATANSYYFDEHGKPRLVRPRPTVQAYWQDRRFPLTDYSFAPRPDEAAA